MTGMPDISERAALYYPKRFQDITWDNNEIIKTADSYISLGNYLIYSNHI